MTDGNGPLLVVLARGLGVEAAARLPLVGSLLGASPWQPLEPTEGDPIDALAPLPVARLADLGVACDRRAVTLGPATLAAQLRAIARRPTGPAPITFVVADEPLAVARAHGCGRGWQDALAQLDAGIGGLRQLLQAGDPPDLWLVALGAPQPVSRTFDLHASLRRHLGRATTAPLRIAIDDGQAAIAADNQRDLERAANLLATPPWTRFGSLGTAPGAGTVRFLAHADVAFGRCRLLARAGRGDEARAMAALPGMPAKATPLSWSELLARVVARGEAWAQERRRLAVGCPPGTHGRPTGRAMELAQPWATSDAGVGTLP